MSAARKAGFHGDHRGVSVLASVFAGVVAAAAFYISFEGLTSIGHLIGLGAFSFAVPIALDGAILSATFLAIVRKAQKRRSSLEWAIVYGASAASSVANFLVHSQRGDGYLGAGVAAAAPLLLLVLSHAIIRTLIVSEPPAPRPSKRAQMPTSATAAATVEAPATLAPKPAARPRPATRTARVPIEAASPEAAALLGEFDALAHHPASSSPTGSPESTRLSEVVRELADDHGIAFTDLAARADHLSSDSLRQRANKMRKRMVSA